MAASITAFKSAAASGVGGGSVTASATKSVSCSSPECCSTSSMLSVISVIFLFYRGKLLDVLSCFGQPGSRSQADVSECFALREFHTLPLNQFQNGKEQADHGAPASLFFEKFGCRNRLVAAHTRELVF